MKKFFGLLVIMFSFSFIALGGPVSSVKSGSVTTSDSSISSQRVGNNSSTKPKIGVIKEGVSLKNCEKWKDKGPENTSGCVDYCTNCSEIGSPLNKKGCCCIGNSSDSHVYQWE